MTCRVPDVPHRSKSGHPIVVNLGRDGPSVLTVVILGAAPEKLGRPLLEGINASLGPVADVANY